jgi:MscS family membrane protein
MNETLLVVLLAASKLLVAVSIVWLFYRAVDIVTDYIDYRTSLTEHRLDPSLASFLNGTMKVLVTLIVLVLVASNMGVNVTGLVAGLGIGGLAVALAAKEPLENLFASLVIFMDRPFRAGDWVAIEGVEGTVENVGFRSTRIRTFYNSLITVPNAEVTRLKVDNLGVRRQRRIKTTISVTYGTPPAKMEAFCAGVRELIRAHPYTRNDRYSVWFDDFGPASLDIQLICHLDTQDYATERRERHRLFLDIMRLAQSMGVEFAFPTQTIYMGKDKPAEPVFPDMGDILTLTQQEVESAKAKAREIAASELGGEGVHPPPFEYGTGSRDESSPQ